MASKQELLRAQIAALQKQIAVEDANEELKRKANDGVLVAASPSPTSAWYISAGRVAFADDIVFTCREAEDSL